MRLAYINRQQEKREREETRGERIKGREAEEKTEPTQKLKLVVGKLTCAPVHTLGPMLIKYATENERKGEREYVNRGPPSVPEKNFPKLFKL